jgi:hypothetical protein
MEASARGRSPLRGEGSVEDLRRCWEGADGSARPFMDFVPIRLVTILENSVRDVVAQAVDYGEPYASRGLSLIARFPAKALVDTLPAVKQERITLGDLASHGFSTGRMDEIIGALTTIFGDGFRNELASVRTLWSEDEGQDLPSIIADLSATIGCLDRLLQVRHILVHEQAANKPYAEEELAHFFSHTAAFVSALEWALIGKRWGTVPRTQSAINIQSTQEMVEALAELDALRGGTAADFAEPKTPDAELEHHWDQYSELSARVRAGYISEEKPGSIAPLLYAIEMTRLARWRVDDIKRLKSRPEGHL